MTAAVDQEKTGLGNYFIANYPPFSFWKGDTLPEATAALNRPPVPGTPLVQRIPNSLMRNPSPTVLSKQLPDASWPSDRCGDWSC